MLCHISFGYTHLGYTRCLRLDFYIFFNFVWSFVIFFPFLFCLWSTVTAPISCICVLHHASKTVTYHHQGHFNTDSENFETDNKIWNTWHSETHRNFAKEKKKQQQTKKKQAAQHIHCTVALSTDLYAYWCKCHRRFIIHWSHHAAINPLNYLDHTRQPIVHYTNLPIHPPKTRRPATANFRGWDGEQQNLWDYIRSITGSPAVPSRV